jgi:hypothetical protein
MISITSAPLLEWYNASHARTRTRVSQSVFLNPIASEPMIQTSWRHDESRMLYSECAARVVVDC